MPNVPLLCVLSTHLPSNFANERDTILPCAVECEGVHASKLVLSVSQKCWPSLPLNCVDRTSNSWFISLFSGNVPQYAPFGIFKDHETHEFRKNRYNDDTLRD